MASVGFPESEAHRKGHDRFVAELVRLKELYEGGLALIHISEPTRRYAISYAVLCLQKKRVTRRPPSTRKNKLCT